MNTVERSALVPYSAADMFALVADVDSYALFLPWCRRSTVHSQDAAKMQASLEVSKGPMRKSFTTLTHLTPHESIRMELVEGPFRRLNGEWRFDQLGEGDSVRPGDAAERIVDLNLDAFFGLFR